MKKGQAAMEYLMTYGWAILIIIVVVAALYAMGVFKVGTAVTCSPCFSYFAYIDYAGGSLIIRNGAHDIGSITVVSPAGVTPSVTSATPGQDITLSTLPTTGDQSVNITYVVTASGLTHSDSATIRQ